MEEQLALRANAPELHTVDAGQPPSLSVLEVYATPPEVAQVPSDLGAHLEKFVNWLQAGLLTKEEFEKAKERILWSS